jgi:hypothetical protein
MAFRSQTIFTFLALLPLSAQTATWEGVRARWRKDVPGRLEISPQGMAFTPGAKSKQPSVGWQYGDIQQLRLSETELEVLTYHDRPYLAGSDQPYRFRLPGKPDVLTVARELARRLDQRLVLALADAPAEPRWTVRVKRLRRLRGSEGELMVAADGVVYKTATRGESRTWRWKDLDNVSREGPFSLTLTTMERALTHYGSRQGFEFQLKEALPEPRYDELWRAIEESKR